MVWGDLYPVLHVINVTPCSIVLYLTIHNGDQYNAIIPLIHISFRTTLIY